MKRAAFITILGALTLYGAAFVAAARLGTAIRKAAA
jgi:hypothetical protein